MDEVFVKIRGKQHYLWRAVDQDGAVVDVFLRIRRDGASAKRFFRRLLRSHGGEPRKIVADKLRSDGVAHRKMIPETIHSTKQDENNRAEQFHEATRVRERGCVGPTSRSSNQWRRLKDSLVCIPRLTICSTLEGI